MVGSLREKLQIREPAGQPFEFGKTKASWNGKNKTKQAVRMSEFKEIKGRLEKHLLS